MLEYLRHQLWMAFGRRRYARSLFAFYEIHCSEGVAVVDDETDIVIEGYPRSANTFAVAAFRLAQRTSRRIAHHIHGPIQILEALDRDIPAVLLLRDPLDAASSLLVRQPNIRPRAALMNYIRFHDPLQSVIGDFVVAPFEVVISRYDQVIAAVNAKWEKNFDVFDPTPENVRKCYAAVEAMDRKDGGRRRVKAETVARPSRERNGAALRSRERILTPALEPLLVEARRIHGHFLQAAGDSYESASRT